MLQRIQFISTPKKDLSIDKQEFIRLLGSFEIVIFEIVTKRRDESLHDPSGMLTNVSYRFIQLFVNGIYNALKLLAFSI